MLEYDLMKSPGLGAFLQAGKAADAADLSQSQTRGLDAGTMSTLQRIFQEGEMHPLKMEEQGLKTTGAGLDNRRKEGQITDEEMARRQKVTQVFMNHAAQTDDIDSALLVAGVKPEERFWQKAQELKQIPPELRQKMYQKWADDDLSSRDKRAQNDAALKKQSELEEKRSTREQANIRTRGEEERKSLAVKLQTEMAKLKAKIDALPKTFQSGAVSRFMEAQQLQALGQTQEAIAKYNEGEFFAREAKELASAAVEAKARGDEATLKAIMDMANRRGHTGIIPSPSPAPTPGQDIPRQTPQGGKAPLDPKQFPLRPE